jgi:hypothetical protein
LQKNRMRFSWYLMDFKMLEDKNITANMTIKNDSPPIL